VASKDFRCRYCLEFSRIRLVGKIARENGLYCASHRGKPEASAR